MQSAIAQQVIQSLTQTYDFNKQKSGWLRGGICPDCGQRQLYTKVDGPWLVRCGRVDKCAWEQETKVLFPHLFESFNKRYTPTKENPNATADAYMQYARGFDLKSIKGWYEQDKYWNPNADKGTATVRFYIDSERKILMERFVEEITITDPDTGERKKRKSNFKGSHQGMWWQPPTFAINDNHEGAPTRVWLVEACLDAIALNINGVLAVATLSCVNYPDKMLKQYQGKNVEFVWALDNDKAGKKYTLKHAQRMVDEGYKVSAAQPGISNNKLDWNDLHQRSRLSARDIETYEYYGKLLVAKSSSEKALLIYNFKGRNHFYFDFKKCMYWFDLNFDKYEKYVKDIEEDADDKTKEELRNRALKESNTITRIANCHFTFLYYQANLVTDEAWYYAQIEFPHGQNATKNTFTGSQISSSAEFKKRLISIAVGGMWMGQPFQLDRIIEDQTNKLKVVQTIDYIGYAKEHRCYVMSDIAVKSGEVITVNEEDYFDTGKTAVKSLQKSISLKINPNLENYKSEWVSMINNCFGVRGIINVAFWFGSFFVEQIRELHGSFPFLAMIGEPGTGKSTIIEFLWKCTGRDNYEGFDPSAASVSALNRNLSQVANMPVILMEGDRDEEMSKFKRFDYNRIKPLYNGRSIAARGVKNSGNETYEPPFRAALIIEQNNEIIAQKAVLERLVQLVYTKDGQSEQTKAIADALRQIPMKEVSGFFIKATQAESLVMKTIKDKYPVHFKTLINLKDISSIRIAETHAQVMALIDALALVTQLPDNVVNKAHVMLTHCALDRQTSINADHPMVQEFWDVYDYLNPATERSENLPILNHAIDENTIAINLNHFVKVASENKQQIPSLSDLKQHLKISKSRKYTGQKNVASCIWHKNNVPKSVRCWIFEKQV